MQIVIFNEWNIYKLWKPKKCVYIWIEQTNTHMNAHTWTHTHEHIVLTNQRQDRPMRSSNENSGFWLRPIRDKDLCFDQSEARLDWIKIMWILCIFYDIHVIFLLLRTKRTKLDAIYIVKYEANCNTNKFSLINMRETQRVLNKKILPNLPLS